MSEDETPSRRIMRRTSLKNLLNHRWLKVSSMETYARTQATGKPCGIIAQKSVSDKEQQVV